MYKTKKKTKTDDDCNEKYLINFFYLKIICTQR